MPRLIPVDHDPFSDVHDPFGSPLVAPAFKPQQISPQMLSVDVGDREPIGGASPMPARANIAPNVSKSGSRASLIPAKDIAKSFEASQFVPPKENHNYDIMSDTGNRIGAMSLDASDPRHVMMDFIHNYEGGGANSLGTQTMLDVRRHIQDLYPDIQMLYGRRVSGARQEAGKSNRFGKTEFTLTPEAAEREWHRQTAQFQDIVKRNSKDGAGEVPRWGVDPRMFSEAKNQLSLLQGPGGHHFLIKGDGQYGDYLKVKSPNIVSAETSPITPHPFEASAAGGDRQPMMRPVEERGRSGRPLYSTAPPKGDLLSEGMESQGIEGAGGLHILHDANGQIQGLYGSKEAAQNARNTKMQAAWNEHGPTYGDEYGGAPPKEWNRVISQWNKEQTSENHVDPNNEGSWYTMDHTGRNYAGSVLEGKPELQQRLEVIDNEWANRPLRYPGASAAARHFRENGDEEDLGKVLTIRKGTGPDTPNLIPVDHDPFAPNQ
jgi:hypothetical protein